MMELKGHTIKAYLDGILLCTGQDVENESYLNNGMAAFGCSRALTRFDNIRVTPV
jgi:hypothetical protein